MYATGHFGAQNHGCSNVVYCMHITQWPKKCLYIFSNFRKLVSNWALRKLTQKLDWQYLTRKCLQNKVKPWWHIHLCTFQFFKFSRFLVIQFFELHPKLCIPSALNIDLILWHTQLIVCAENVKSWVFPFTFQAYTMHAPYIVCVLAYLNFIFEF